MGRDAHAPGGSGGETVGARAVFVPAAQALTRIVHTYAPAQTPLYRPAHWRGLQPDPYALRRESDALADREGLHLELTAIRIADEAIAISPELNCTTTTAYGEFRGISWVKGVSWIMNATRPATETAVHIAACRLLAQAAATDLYLRHRGVLSPMDALGPT
ncbi:hypothetical protein ETD83_26705 [Actinomadura soli]|uniref:Uncharacterized protein n=1 Tax=Actinomadura soli TaxID=2508997 RepID=A0A5C4J622_9ACTN|nr:hypothetical protein [Actinomadura soli]TMQ92734.1 hypothetical protein ETD83_26705 [Actinomadura soli]